MDTGRHDLLDRLGVELKTTVTRAAMASATTVDTIVQIALGREVSGLEAEQLTQVRAIVARDGLAARLAPLATDWPLPPTPAPALETGPIEGPVRPRGAFTPKPRPKEAEVPTPTETAPAKP